MPDLERPAVSPHPLERRVERLTAAVAVLAVGFALSVLWNLVPRPQLDASRFVLRDAAGRWRGSLEVDPQGLPTIRLNNRAGRATLYGVAFDDGTQRFRLGDSHGDSRLVLEVSPDGSPHLQLVNDEGRTGIHAWLAPTGQPWVDLRWGSVSRSFTLPDSARSAKAERPRGSEPRGR